MRIRRRRARVVLGLLLTAVIAATAGSLAAIARSNNRVEGWTQERAEFVEAAVGDAIDAVVADLEAIAAYVEASQPSLEEFSSYVDQVNGTYAAIGVAYAAVVPVDELDDHIADVRDTLSFSYEVSRMDRSGGLEPISVSGRSYVYPVVRFAPGDAIKPFLSDVPVEELGIGLDGGYDPTWRASVAAAVAANEPAVSDFIDLEFEPLPVTRVFFTSVPVHGSSGEVVGLVAAPMIEPLLLAGIERRSLDGVEWEVLPVGQAPSRVDPVRARVFPLEMPGATWQLAIQPSAEARADLVGTPWWVLGITAGLLATLGGLTLVLYLSRRIEQRRADAFRRVVDDKDRFLAAVSHELRTPLTAVTGLAHELRDRGDFTREERDVLLGLLAEQSDELGSIVEDLLIAARNDIGKVVIHYEPVDLRAEVGRAMDTAAVTADCSGPALFAWADAQRVRQIVRNLLSNARRYGGETIRVMVEPAETEVCVVIADSGPPIPVAERARIFESYTSAHRPRHAVQSVGLGLFIARSLARAMGGELAYEHDGKWSRFVLTLPATSGHEGHSDSAPHLRASAAAN